MFFRRANAVVFDFNLLICAALVPIFIADAWLPEYMDALVGQPPTPLMGAMLLWLAFVLLFYFSGFESSAFMATTGKLLMRLKVIRRNGERLTFMQAFYRMAFWPARDMVPAFIP